MVTTRNDYEYKLYSYSRTVAKRRTFPNFQYRYVFVRIQQLYMNSTNRCVSIHYNFIIENIVQFKIIFYIS